MSTALLEPSADALAMREFMLEEQAIRRTILEETIAAAEDGQIKESGRTICGPETALPPAVRFERSVELQRCPVANGAGVLHSHVSRPELLTPQHSIPDTSNVILESSVVASMVVGLETSEILLEPTDHDAGHRAFEEAFGIPVDSPHDVIRAIDNGQIESFHAVRQRLKMHLGPLYETVDTAFPDLRARADDLGFPAIPATFVHGHAPADAPIAVCGPAQRLAVGQQRAHAHGRFDHAARLRQQQSRIGETFRQSQISDQVRTEIIGSVISAVVGQGLRALF